MIDKLIPPLLGYYTMAGSGAPAAPVITTVVYDTFTDTDATALNLHAPDINVAGNPWVPVSTVITSNKADGTSTYNGARILTTLSDCKITFDCDNTGDAATSDRDSGIRLRRNATGRWQVTISKYSDVFRIVEYDGNYTVRTSASVVIGTGTHTLVAIANGQTISATCDGANDITYGSAAAFLTEKEHGMALYTTSVGDNFKVETI